MSGKIILVEGIDQVGKSTFCEKLRLALYNDLTIKKEPIVLKINHNFYDMSECKSKYESAVCYTIAQLVRDTNSFIIQDRGHISDFVYGICDRNYSYNESLNNLLRVEEKIKELELDYYLTVYVRPENEVWLKTAEEKHGSDLKDKLKLFESVVCKITTMQYITTSYENFNETIECIIRGVRNEDIQNGKY